MKKILAVLMAGIIAITATGCKTNDKSGEKGEDKSLENVLEKKELVMGLDDKFVPMGYRDENNEIIGFDIDLAKAVAELMGVELKLQPIVWTNNIMELESGNIDVVWNGMSVTEERQEKMSLTIPYMKNKMTYAVLKDSGITTGADLKDKKIGVQNGSSAQKSLEESEIGKSAKEIIGFAENVTGFMDLESKGLDALCIDMVFADYYIEANKKDHVILDEVLVEEDYAIGLRTGDKALTDEINKSLKTLKDNGKLAEISEKWFGEDITTVS